MKPTLVAVFESDIGAPSEGFLIGEEFVGSKQHVRLGELGLVQCPQCRLITKFPSKRRKVKIVMLRHFPLPADFGDLGHLPFVSKRVCDLIGPDLEKHTHVLEIVSPDGRPIKDRYCILAKRRVVIRGDGNSRLGHCVICGRRSYYAKGDRYVLSRDLTRPVLDAGHRLIVDEAAYLRIREIRLRNSKIIPLSVRSKPVDKWPAALPLFGPKGK